MILSFCQSSPLISGVSLARFQLSLGGYTRIPSCTIVLCYLNVALLEINIHYNHRAGIEGFFPIFFFYHFDHSPGIYSSRVTGISGCCTNCSLSVYFFRSLSSALFFFLASILRSLHSFHAAQTTFCSFILTILACSRSFLAPFLSSTISSSHESGVSSSTCFGTYSYFGHLL